MAAWQLGPVLRGIRGHRSAAVLVTLQLGIGLAITVLSVLIGDYVLGRNDVTPPAAESELGFVEVQLSRRASNAADRAAAIHAELAAIEGCVGVTGLGPTPLRMHGRSADELRTTSDATPRAAFSMDVGADFARVAGISLIAGRDFLGDDLRARGLRPAIVSRSLAAALWPGTDAIGATFESRAHGRAVVVGVSDELRARLFGPEDVEILYASAGADPARVVLLVRAAPGRVDAVRSAVLARANVPGQHATWTAAAERARYSTDPVSAVIAIIATMIGAILLVILVGSMGLTYFLVASRRRDIGLHRAMGATRRDVVRFFVLENALLTGAGALLGLGIVALVLPTFAFEQPGFAVRWHLVAVATGTVVLLNLIATLIPARKAAAVPPVVASRTA